jgi:hypothetical protein
MEVSVQLHTPGRFTLTEIAPGTHWIGGWMDPRAGLEPVAEEKSPFITRAKNRTPVAQPVAWSLYWLGYTNGKMNIDGVGI